MQLSSPAQNEEKMLAAYKPSLTTLWSCCLRRRKPKAKMRWAKDNRSVSGACSSNAKDHKLNQPGRSPDSQFQTPSSKPSHPLWTVAQRGKQLTGYSSATVLDLHQLPYSALNESNLAITGTRYQVPWQVYLTRFFFVNFSINVYINISHSYKSHLPHIWGS